MATFLGGKIPLTAVAVSGITAGVTAGVQSGNTNAAVNAAVSSVATSLVGYVNVGLSQALGSAVSSQSGLSLTDGKNLLKTQLTSLVSSTLSNQLSGTINKTLGSIGGPLASIAAPVANKLATGAVNYAVGALTGKGSSLKNSIAGAFGGGGGGLGGNIINDVSTKIWPGAGGEGEADYGGFAHNLGPNGPDVVFSIVPANNGPQTQGTDKAQNTPTVPTTLPKNNFTVVPPSASVPGAAVVKEFKIAAMTRNLGALR
jgi:hypothetical protein